MPSLNVPYSAQYATATREGHEGSPPSLGAPSPIWHMAISPHWPDDPISIKETVENLHHKLVDQYETVRRRFFARVNRLLLMLQEHAAFPSRTPPFTFDPDALPLPWRGSRETAGEPFGITEPGTIRFTLWWRDDDARLAGEPSEDALRVKVQAAAHRDFVTVSFYLDAGQQWDGPIHVRGMSPPGRRRRRIFSEVQKVRDICERRLVAGTPGVDAPLLPESIDAGDACALMDASRYLYSTLWDEFCAAFGIADLAEVLGSDGDGGMQAAGGLSGLSGLSGLWHGIRAALGLGDSRLLGRDGEASGRIFANFRGLVISTRGLDGRDLPFPGSAGAEPFERFKGNGGIDKTGSASTTEPNESNAVLKAFWPFLRRITPFADLREFIACGVMHWRALYVTALGSPPAFAWQEEGRGSETFVPARHLPEELLDAAGKYDALSGPGGEEPVRYLLLTKGEPHRQQIGRVVDRINIMGTMRLIALRDWTIIRDASTQIQLRGLELDTIMKKWSVGSRKIRRWHEMFWWVLLFRTRRRDKRDERLQKLATRVEQDLIYLSAALDEVGGKAVHGLHFRINRSRFYIAEFESLLGSLNIGNIDTWLAYDQFVRRGLKPAFDFIDGVGTRLLGLRNRLQTVLEGIETSALVIQTSATRSNTAQLRRLAWGFRVQNFIIAIAGLVAAYYSENESWKAFLGQLQAYLAWAWELVNAYLRSFN